MAGGRKPVADWPAVLAEAEANGWDMRHVARMLGVTHVAVFHQCRKLGVVLPTGKRGNPPVCDWSKVLRDAVKRGIYSAQLARELGVTKTAVYLQCKRCGISLPHAPTRPALRSAA